MLNKVVDLTKLEEGRLQFDTIVSKAAEYRKLEPNQPSRHLNKVLLCSFSASRPFTRFGEEEERSTMYYIHRAFGVGYFDDKGQRIGRNMPMLCLTEKAEPQTKIDETYDLNKECQVESS